MRSSLEPPTEYNVTGLVFDVKRFALHDGPGIRSTAFLKGCPLSCVWCQNPEGIAGEPLLWYHEKQCIQCGRCIEACPKGALSRGGTEDPFVIINRQACNSTGDCVAACPSGALRWDSRSYEAEELVDVLARDAAFYDSSGGGITLSGGEPLHRPDFALEVLTRCRDRGFHTAVETTLYAARKVVDRFIPLVDLFLADLKLIDSESHREYTGVDNALIMDNIAYLAEKERPMTIRVPLIPGITDTEENLRGIARFVAGLPGEVPTELLNFNPLAEAKYRSLNRDYRFADTLAPLDGDTIHRLKGMVRDEGARVL